MANNGHSGPKGVKPVLDTGVPVDRALWKLSEVLAEIARNNPEEENGTN